MFFKGKSQNISVGMGIGLALCDDFVKQHGGSMVIESVYQKGTSVKIRLEYPILDFKTKS